MQAALLRWFAEPLGLAKLSTKRDKYRRSQAK